MIYSYAKNLPDSFAKNTESNNYKLLKLNAETIMSLLQDIEDVDASTDLNLAVGKTLDLFGDMVGQKRGMFDDSRYRYMILTRIARNFVQGDYQSTLDAIVRMFNCNQEDVALEDMSIDDDVHPCVVRLIKMPLFVLVGAGFTTKQAKQMIESLLPICVTLVADNFEGTFEFSATVDEHDKKAGFADRLQTYGGYFGLALGEDENNFPLPI